MIIELLINLFSSIANFLVNLLPTGTIPSEIDTAFTFLASAFEKANVFFPVTVVLTMLSIMLTIEFALFAFKASNWFLNKIRGSG
jgi:hypothetical protein